jgi:hypothetical protein
MSGVDTVTVGRSGGSLQFGDVERGPKGEIWYLTVRLRVPGLDAALRVSAHYASGFDELVAFFRELAGGWRGWQGVRSYESLERELELTATHDGHVHFACRLRQTSIPSGWSASSIILVDPGEEMTRAAGDLAALLQGPAPEP